MLSDKKDTNEQLQNLSELCIPIALFVVGYHYQPIATVLFAILFAVIALCLGLRIYFMSINDKLEGIAKAKARHGIPLDQPHHIDRILKSGYHRIP